jgi:hypothetical protein
MAHSAANDAVRAVAMQHYRVLADLHEDGAFFGAKGFRQEVDLNFMLVALRRLRRAAILAAQVEGCQLSLLQPVRQFDEALPGLATMRNVGEHIDDYIMGSNKRRHRDVGPGSGGVRVWRPSESGGYVFAWVGQEIDIDSALKGESRRTALPRHPDDHAVMASRTSPRAD